MLQDTTIAAPDAALGDAVRHAIDVKTKPHGSLGRIEALALQMALAQGTERPLADPARLFIFAGDHGIVAEGVSAWPQEVTAQMVLNFLAGGAASTVFARANGAEVTVVDAGLATELADAPGLVRAGIRKGTRNAAVEDALTGDEVGRALAFGAGLAGQAVADGARVIAPGEMGIGNTTPSSAIASVLLGRSPSEVVGVGTGLDEEQLFEKAIVIERAISLNSPNTGDPLEVLAKLGGFEIAGLTGVILRAASARLPILLDGFITSAAALVAARLCPTVIEYLIASHCSVEPGHRLVLEELRLQPLLELDLRLGEGTGAALAMHLVDGALAVLNEMATFEEAGVANRADHA